MDALPGSSGWGCRLLLAGAIVASLQVVGWSTLLRVERDGRAVVVLVHQPVVPLFGWHYYVAMEGAGELQSTEWGVSLKSGPPLIKLWESRSADWRQCHYLGSLGAMDGRECAPNRVDWNRTELVVWSGRGLVARFAVR